VFGETSVAMASGWMMLRGVRRRRGFDRGFVVSDHADFPGLMQAIAATGASRVLATHGFAEPLARLLRERGLDADTLATRFTGETVGDTDDDDSHEPTTEDGGAA
jgi:putative mRNA 3-end processing factor